MKKFLIVATLVTGFISGNLLYKEYENSVVHYQEMYNSCAGVC